MLKSFAGALFWIRMTDYERKKPKKTRLLMTNLIPGLETTTVKKKLKKNIIQHCTNVDFSLFLK